MEGFLEPYCYDCDERLDKCKCKCDRSKFNLSDEGEDEVCWEGTSYSQRDVKEFIRLLKEKYENMFIDGKLRECMKTISREEFMEKIDKLAGEKLI